MILNDNFPIYLIGDNHGEYEKMFRIIKQYGLQNCYLIHVGDGGEGFSPPRKQIKQFKFLNNFFKNRNIFYKSIRGNHSDPKYFSGHNRCALSHFELLADYTTATYNQKEIMFIGGAISIDRVDRKLNTSYWLDEALNFDADRCKKVDILVTHTSPFFKAFNKINESFIQRDTSLTQDINKERADMVKILGICKPELHVCGHFHVSSSERIDTCTHRILSIDEVIRVSIFNNKVVVY